MNGEDLGNGTSITFTMPAHDVTVEVDESARVERGFTVNIFDEGITGDISNAEIEARVYWILFAFSKI